jgi:hypothetical protein
MEFLVLAAYTRAQFPISQSCNESNTGVPSMRWLVSCRRRRRPLRVSSKQPPEPFSDTCVESVRCGGKGREGAQKRLETGSETTAADHFYPSKNP